METVVINPELKIAGVHVADLPEIDKAIMTAAWDDGGTADALTFLYDPAADYVAVNLDHSYKDALLDLAETYLQADAKSRKIFRKQTTRFAEECRVLDNCLLCREIADMLRISGEMMPGGLDLNERIKLYKAIACMHSDEVMRLNTAYCCGYIQGVRHERARA